MGEKRFGRNLDLRLSAGFEKERIWYLVLRKSPKAIQELGIFFSTIENSIKAEIGNYIGQLTQS